MMLAETGARRATAGPDGRFRLGGLRPGAWEVGASDHARYSKSPTIVGLGVAEQVADVELLVGTGPVIRGRVVDDAGAPAPRTHVQAFSRGESSESTADDAGAFALEGLRAGAYVLVAGSEAYLPGSRARVAVTDRDVDNVVVTVNRGRMVKGHVEPRQVCDVQQELDERAGMMTTLTGVTTAADGEFALGPLSDVAIRLIARCARGDQGSALVAVARDMPEAIVPVAPGASIAGRVLDGDGKGVAGVAAMATNVSGGERTMIMNGAITTGVQALTDATGAYKLDGLPPGPYRVGVLDRGKPLRLRAPPPQVELAANEHKTGVDFSVDRPRGASRVR